MVEREVTSWGIAEGRGVVLYLRSGDFVVLDPKFVRELYVACDVFRERVGG